MIDERKFNIESNQFNYNVQFPIFVNFLFVISVAKYLYEMFSRYFIEWIENSWSCNKSSNCDEIKMRARFYGYIILNS